MGVIGVPSQFTSIDEWVFGRLNLFIGIPFLIRIVTMLKSCCLSWLTQVTFKVGSWFHYLFFIDLFFLLPFLPQTILASSCAKGQSFPFIFLIDNLVNLFIGKVLLSWLYAILQVPSLFGLSWKWYLCNKWYLFTIC